MIVFKMGSMSASSSPLEAMDQLLRWLLSPLGFDHVLVNTPVSVL